VSSGLRCHSLIAPTIAQELVEARLEANRIAEAQVRVCHAIQECLRVEHQLPSPPPILLPPPPPPPPRTINNDCVAGGCARG